MIGNLTLYPRVLAALLLVLGTLHAGAQFTPANPEWNQPIEPFRVVGNLYYVGVSGVSSFLITTPEGHILLDAGFRETAPLIEANIQKIGFRVADIRFILISHGHYDHVGGVAEIRAHSKAALLASPAEASLLSRGGKGDFAFGDKFQYPAITPDRLLHDGEEVRLGNAALTAHFTPGHTLGCTTWTTTIHENGKPYRVVIPCGVSAPGYKLVDNPKYPNIQSDYAALFATLRSLPCDIFLTPHGWDFELQEKIKAKAADPGHNPFVDPEGYRRYVDKSQSAIAEAVAKQKAK